MVSQCQRKKSYGPDTNLHIYTDGQPNRQTDRQSDFYITPLTSFARIYRNLIKIIISLLSKYFNPLETQPETMCMFRLMSCVKSSHYKLYNDSPHNRSIRSHIRTSLNKYMYKCRCRANRCNSSPW